MAAPGRRAAAASVLAAGLLTAIAVPVATAMGGGQPGSRAQVPWTKVGPGWELVQYKPDFYQTSAHRAHVVDLDAAILMARGLARHGWCVSPWLVVRPGSLIRKPGDGERGLDGLPLRPRGCWISGLLDALCGSLSPCRRRSWRRGPRFLAG